MFYLGSEGRFLWNSMLLAGPLSKFSTRSICSMDREIFFFVNLDFVAAQLTVNVILCCISVLLLLDFSVQLNQDSNCWFSWSTSVLNAFSSIKSLESWRFSSCYSICDIVFDGHGVFVSFKTNVWLASFSLWVCFVYRSKLPLQFCLEHQSVVFWEPRSCRGTIFQSSRKNGQSIYFSMRAIYTFC